MSTRRSSIAIGALVLLGLAGLAIAQQSGSDAASARERGSAPIVFVCRNGVAMSLWSARTFERLAAERGLPLRAISRASAATFTEVPLRMKLALALDGYRVGSYRPQVVSDDDVRAASLVVLIDTELPSPASVGDTAIELWSGFPPMREQYFASRAELQKRVEDLVARLAAVQASRHIGE